MKKESGFTMIEIAVVILLIGLLMGGLMVGLTGQIEQRRYNDTQKGLDDIKGALVGYAIKNGYLPCPDKTAGGGFGTANDGQEDTNTGTGVCIAQEGNIPWATLGVPDVDAWAHRFHYRVTAAYSNHNVPFLQSTPGDISVCSTSPAGACSSPLATLLPVVLVSYGPNGKGAITTSGALIPAPAAPVPGPPSNSDEYENTDQDTTFVSRPRSAVGGALGEFDDQVAWLTSFELVNKMTAAGKAPAP